MSKPNKIVIAGGTGPVGTRGAASSFFAKWRRMERCTDSRKDLERSTDVLEDFAADDEGAWWEAWGAFDGIIEINAVLMEERGRACEDRLAPTPVIREAGPTMTGPSATDKAGRKDFRETLAPLHKATWLPNRLGSWSAGVDDYWLEQYLFVGPRGGGDYFRVGIFAGMHGDETAGVFAAVRFLQELARQPDRARGYEVYVYPLCNPSGFEDGTRHARSGRDLNREFWLGSREPEVELLERQIRTLRFDGLISLHADDDSPGLYAFALGAQVTQHVVEPALRAAEKILPRNCEATIDNFTARNGLIRQGYPGMLCAAPEARPRPFEIVFETPSHADLEKQIEANLVFLRHALEQYQQLQAIGQGL